MTPSDLISQVLKMGGSLTVIDGMRLEVCLPETQQGNALIEKLRSVRDEVLCMLLLPRRENFHHWTLDRCLYRDRCFSGIGALWADFSEWAIAHDFVPCTRGTFEALLRDAGFLYADGLVSGLMLKASIVSKCPAQDKGNGKHDSSRKPRFSPLISSQRPSAETLLEIARDPRHLGAEIGFFSVLHSWDQRLQFHPYVHCVLAAGGLAPDHSSWISSRRSFFLPVKVLSRVFRGKFVAGLKTAFHEGTLQFHGNLVPLAQPRAFAAWLRMLFRHDWVVYSKRPFGGPEHALRYLGAYTHRVAISNHRLVTLSENNVTFRWRDSAHGNKKRLMTLPVEEFLRRFLLHLLPRGFVRIRNFGFLANRQRATLLPLCFRLLQTSAQISTSIALPAADLPHPLWNCPVCGGTMHVVERLSAAQLLLRSPPRQEYAA